MLLLCPRSIWCKTSRKDDPDWNHICAFQIPHLSFGCFSPPPANTALKPPEKLAAGGPQLLPPFPPPPPPPVPPEGSRGTKLSQQLCRPLPPRSEMWGQSPMTLLAARHPPKHVVKRHGQRETRCYCCRWELANSFVLGVKKKKNPSTILLHPRLKLFLRFCRIWITFPPTSIHFCSFHHLLFPQPG